MCSGLRFVRSSPLVGGLQPDRDTELEQRKRQINRFPAEAIRASADLIKGNEPLTATSATISGSTSVTVTVANLISIEITSQEFFDQIPVKPCNTSPLARWMMGPKSISRPR